MTDETPNGANANKTEDGREQLETTAVSSTYKVLGEFTDASGAGVLGKNTAGSGTPIGVEGAVPNASDGYGLSTPDDARVEGGLATTSSHVVTVDGDRVCLLGPVASGLGGNVVLGHPQNEVASGANAGTVGGGGYERQPNRVLQNYGTVGGGLDNTAGDYSATVAGGNTNTADGQSSTIGGGYNNSASGSESTVGGGRDNTATSGSDYATVGGGQSNTAGDYSATVAGGNTNTANEWGSTIGGGYNNSASGQYTTVGGGTGNTASGNDATVGGGENNTASGSQSTVGGGLDNIASGSNATIPGGRENTVAGHQGFAAGWRAKTESSYSFVWNDGSYYHDVDGDGSEDGLSSAKDIGGSGVTGDNTFHASATGGFRFITGSNAVTYIAGGSTGWSTASTRAAKTNVDPVDPREVLAGVEDLEVATWEYKDDDGDGAGVTHIGPMAEQFHDAFDVGASDAHINAINADGVALAAIQGLSAELEEARERLDAKDARIEELEAETDDLRTRLAAVEAHVGAASVEKAD